MMIHHVLIPLDGSELAEKAINASKSVLRPQGKITLVTAIQHPNPPIFAYPSPDVLHEIEEDVELIENADENARAYMERVAKNLQLNGYQVEIEISVSDPGDLILELAEKLHVDMIVMCSHGRSGLDRLLFGSVTQKVLGATYCPVLVIPNRERVNVEDSETAPTTNPSPAL